eukprot:TRINITY_DN274_c0_g1_i16.p1 TRINITY_DN274_c0_g1~~TRINITY_DN274_c0_g1_i16.p1  ORF type:complete len:1300 (-),score=533.02 TRINITY_DN274_c0_g1_i16:565-4464(-)
MSVRSKKPISDRISIFEKSQASQMSSSNSRTASGSSSPVITPGRNISALKSQFSAAVAHDQEPPPKSPILIQRSNNNRAYTESLDSEASTPSPPNTANGNAKNTESAKPSKPTKGTPSSIAGRSKTTPSNVKTPSKTTPSNASPTKTRKTPSPSSTVNPPKTALKSSSSRPISPTKKPSSNPSPSVKKSPLRSNKPETKTLKSSPKRPGSPTKAATPSEGPSKKLSLSRILSPEPPKKDAADLKTINESGKASLDRRDSHQRLERRDSNKSVVERRDSNRSMTLERGDSHKALERRDSNRSSTLERKDSNKALERKDSNKSIVDSPVRGGRVSLNESFQEEEEEEEVFLERKASATSVTGEDNIPSISLERQDSESSFVQTQQEQQPHDSLTFLMERKDSTQSVLDHQDAMRSERKDSNQSLAPPQLDLQDEDDAMIQSVIERRESAQSLFERQDSSQSVFPERKDSAQSIFERQNSSQSVIPERKDSAQSLFEGQNSTQFVLPERKDSAQSFFERQNSSQSVLERADSVVSVLERKDSLNSSFHEGFLERKESMQSVLEDREGSKDCLLGGKQEEASEEKRSLPVNGGFPPPRCVTPPLPKEENESESECPGSLPTVKVTVEDIKLVKRDSSGRLPPTTVVSDPEEEEYEDVSQLNDRNTALSGGVTGGKTEQQHDESHGTYRRNSIEKHIDTRVINAANYMKSPSPLHNASVVSSPPHRYWTNQALQNDNSQTISEALKLDLEFKEEKINALNKELESIHHGGAIEEEISHLKKQKSELDARLMDQEEELDDLAGQVQMLEQSKIKLEMSIAAQKKEHRKELGSKEEELEDARAAAQKRIKALEQQLENEHEERMAFVREKHELETKIMNLQELASRSTDEEYVIKLKKNLKKTKALLKDAQCMIDMNRNDSSSKIVLRQLKNQLEDAEFAKTAAIKSRQNTEMELTEVQQQLDDVMRSKNDLEDKMMRICREKSDALTQLEDNEEELSDIMKKYKAAVSQLSVDQITITQQSTQITELEEERHRLKETLSELNQKIDNLESDNISSVTHSRLELKIRELESKLELEQATRGRMETQIGRLKEAIEKVNHECDVLRNKELNSQDLARKLQRQLRDSKEDYASLSQKEMEANSKKQEYEKQLELAEAEVITVKNDLKLALKRFDQLQASLEGDSSEGDCMSDGESDSSDCEVSIFLDHHRRAMSVQKERESVARELSAQRELRASMAREMSISRPLETMSEQPEEASSSIQLEDDDDTLPHHHRSSSFSPILPREEEDNHTTQSPRPKPQEEIQESAA